MIHVPVKVRAIAEPLTGHIRDAWLEFFQRLGRQFGTWTQVAFDAANFVGFTVQEADHLSFAYAAYGQRVDLDMVLRTTTSGAIASVTIALPAGVVAARPSTAIVQVNDNGTTLAGCAKVATDGTVITITRIDGAAFTDLRAVEGQLSIQVAQ
jgi:hypothetical protein